MLRILPILLLLLFPAAASAAPADIDRGYGSNGHTVLDSGGPDEVSAMAVQPDGKTVVAASTRIKDDGVVMRFTVGGAPDGSFGGGDGVAFVESAGVETINAIAVQPDGKIVVAGRTAAGFNGIVRRLNADGSPDKQFGTDGLAVLDSGGNEVAWGVAIQPDGKIVAVGDTSVNDDLAAYRLTAQGKPDNTFDEDGARGIDAGGQETAYGVALQADGKIVVAGRSYKNGDHPLVARFDSSGKPDETFGAGGWRSPAGDGLLFSMAVQRDGTIVAVGEEWSSNQDDGVVYRFAPTGTPDKVLLDLGSDEEAYAVAVQRDDKLVVAGWTELGDDPVVWRLRADGSGDPAFGAGGATILTGLGIGWVDDVDVQADGKIVVAAERQTTNPDVLVTRLLGDYQPPPTAQPQPQPQSGGQPPAKVVRCGGLAATIVGTPRRDVIRGTRRRDVIAALGGNDVVRGMGGNDVICGGAGKDRLIGGKGRDRLVGGPGRDRQTQ